MKLFSNGSINFFLTNIRGLNCKLCYLIFLSLVDIAPVIEGAVHHIASRRFEVGGVDLTRLLAQELGKSNPDVNLKLSDVERLKEKYSCCAEDELAYEKLLNNSQKEQHTLPDGQVIY